MLPANRISRDCTALSLALHWTLGLILGGVVFNTPARCETTAATPGLSAALEGALERLGPRALPEAPVGAGWLAGPATLSAIHLESDERLGTDETELSLSFPIKSPRQRESDRTLSEAEPDLARAQTAYRRWYLSGTLRALHGRYCTAAAEMPAAERAEALLKEVAGQLQAQVEAGSAERFSLLAVQRSALDAAQRRQGLAATAAQSRQQFSRLTGVERMPPCTGDGEDLPTGIDFTSHPQLVLLAQNLERDEASLLSSSPQSSPWTVGVVGRELTVADFSERQLGLSLSLPLNLGDGASTSTRSARRALHRAYWQQRDQVVQTMQLQWEAAQGRVAALTARAQQAGAAFDTSALDRLLEATRASRELPIELKLSRMQTLLDASAEAAVTAARLNAARETLRQLAGESL